MSSPLSDGRNIPAPAENDIPPSRRKDSTAIDLSTYPLPHGFDPIDFDSTKDSHYSPPFSFPGPDVDISPAAELPVQGLGIANRRLLERKPVGGISPPTPSNPFRSPSVATFTSPRRAPSKPFASPQSRSTFPSPNLSTPTSSRPLLSPEDSYLKSNGAFSPLRPLHPPVEEEEEDGDISRGTKKFAKGLDLAFAQINEPQISEPRILPQSVHGDICPGSRRGSIAEDDTYNNRPQSFAPSMLSGDRRQFIDGCPAKHDIHRNRASWVSISILILSVYSSVFSGIWLLLALIQPRYGRIIHSGGSFTPSTASTVFALFAKTIELSFVTVFVSFLGQVLSRRSLMKASRGVTIAELTMRTWVIQPGFMITHWDHLAHAGATFLGIVSLVAAIIAMFYTTASDALVSPHLRFGNWENKVMTGLVKASYADPVYIADTCQTPISTDLDPLYSGTTCLSVMHAGQAYHSSIAFLATWTEISNAGQGVSSDLAARPPPPSMLYDNTTVIGTWVATNTSNMTSAYTTYNRIVNNVTMSMPHSGIFQAARESKNGILQPELLEGVGEYAIKASVVSPSLNVLCVNMNKTELAPLVYTEWPNARLVNSTSSPGQLVPSGDYQNDIQLANSSSYLNSTVVDDIFEWGAGYARQPPIFPMYPIDFNSLTNISAPFSDSDYMLIKSAATTDYTLCQVRSFLSPYCSTYYNVTGVSEGHMTTNCEDPDDKLRYDKSVSPAPISRNVDWRNVGSEWLLALSLNTGISDANSSIARMLSQMVPTAPSYGAVKLNPLMPSLGETLAVMAGNTLLMSAQDAQFYHYWSYESHILDPGAEEKFNASISSQQYTSGLAQKWQGIFYVVLVLVFATNIFCLVYFIVRSGLVTDYTEPQNLFALAVNSPPSETLSGSCGAGPEGDQLNVDWHVTHEDESGHFFLREGNVDEKPERGDGFEMRRRNTRGYSHGHGHAHNHSHSGEGLMLPQSTGLSVGSPKARQSYMMLNTKRNTWL